MDNCLLRVGKMVVHSITVVLKITLNYVFNELHILTHFTNNNTLGIFYEVGNVG